MLEFGVEVSDEPEASPIPFAVSAFHLTKKKMVRETFTARGEVPSTWLNLGTQIENNIIITGQQMRAFVERVVVDEDRPRLVEFLDAPEHRTEMRIIQQIFEGLQTTYLNLGNPQDVEPRPTGSPSGSTTRRGRSGGTTTARRSSKASTSPGSLAAVR